LQDNQGRIEAFGNALGAKVGNEIDYVVGKVQEFWPVVKNAAIQIKNMAVAFRQWEGFKPTIIALVSAFVLYRTTITTIILVTKAWATWLKIQSAAMAIYRGAVTAISAVTKVWTVVQGALNVVMSLNPIGLLIIGIGLLIGVIILAWNKSEGFRKVVTAVWNAIKVAISATIAWLAEAIPAAFNAIVDFVVFWGTVFIQLHVAVWTAVYNFVATIVTTVWSFIVSVWTRISTSTSTAFNAVKNFIVNTWNSIKNSVFTTLTSLWNKVKEIWDRIVAFFKGINLFDTGKQLIQSLIDGVVNMADTAIQKVKGIATDIGNAVTDAFSFSSPSVTVTPSVDGSHAKGLPRVPWDGYIAELHEGERVLTKEETDDYDSYQHGTPDTAPARATYSTTKAQPERSTAAPQGELKVSLSLDIRADASDANMAPNIAQAVRAEIEKVLEQVARAKGVNISYGNN
jgi:phage-related protein